MDINVQLLQKEWTVHFNIVVSYGLDYLSLLVNKRRV